MVGNPSTNEECVRHLSHLATSLSNVATAATYLVVPEATNHLQQQRRHKKATRTSFVLTSNLAVGDDLIIFSTTNRLALYEVGKVLIPITF